MVPSPRLDDSLVPLDLPEHGQLSLPVAGLGARLAAALLDASLALGVALAAMAVGAYAVVGGAGGDPTLLAGAAVAIFALVPVLFPLVFELAGRGRSPGKRVLRLRVLSADGSPATGGQLALRNVLRLIDFLPFGYLVGLLAAFASPRGQRLGDLVAGTLVIREDAGALVELTGAAQTPPAGGDLAGIGPGLLQAAQLLSAPGRQLDPAVRRTRVAELIAAVRRQRPDLAGDTDDELWERLRRGVGTAP